MSLRDMLEEKLKRFEELERMMSDPAVASDSRRISATAREHGSLARFANKYRSFKKINEEIAALIEMSGSADPDERDMAQAELVELREKREVLWNEILELTIGGED